MWPHSITIGLDGRAISIGTDSPEALASLEPWRIPDVGEPIDYCLELAPAAPAPGGPRAFPGLYHGSQNLVRSRDAARVEEAFLRVLASHIRPPGEGQVRLALMPVVRDGVALLAPPATITAVPDRWLLTEGFQPFYTVSSLVDAGRGEVLVDPPLGRDESPLSVSFGGWWLPPQYRDTPLSPGFAVAEVMTLVTAVTRDTAQATLRAVATLVERANPSFAPHAVEAVKQALAGDRAAGGGGK